VLALYQNVKAGLREGEAENHAVFYAAAGPKKFIVDKETVGPHSSAEAALNVFPEERAITASRPVFLFRHPVATWNGWYGQGWTRYDLFELAYVHTFQTFLFALTVDRSAVLGITYERLVQRPEETLQAICVHWGVPFRAELLKWHTGLQPNVTVHGGQDFEMSAAAGSFSQVQRSRSIAGAPRDLVIPAADVARIALSPLPELYKSVEHRALEDREHRACT